MNFFSNADEEVLLHEVKMGLMWGLFIFILCNLDLSLLTRCSVLSVTFLTEILTVGTGGVFIVIQTEVQLWGTSSETGHHVQHCCNTAKVFVTKMKGYYWGENDCRCKTAWLPLFESFFPCFFFWVWLFLSR